MMSSPLSTTPSADRGRVGSEHETLAFIRRVLGALLLLGMTGTAAELLLLKHDEEALQLVPLVLLAAGIVAVSACMIRPTRAGVTALQALMVLFIASGAAGIVFHYQANTEFQLESDPGLRGTALLWKVLQAKAPPALAPGIMTQLGLLGLAYTYRRKGAL